MFSCKTKFHVWIIVHFPTLALVKWCLYSKIQPVWPQMWAINQFESNFRYPTPFWVALLFKSAEKRSPKSSLTNDGKVEKIKWESDHTPTKYNPINVTIYEDNSYRLSYVGTHRFRWSSNSFSSRIRSSVRLLICKTSSVMRGTVSPLCSGCSSFILLS